MWHHQFNIFLRFERILSIQLFLSTSNFNYKSIQLELKGNGSKKELLSMIQYVLQGTLLLQCLSINFNCSFFFFHRFSDSGWLSSRSLETDKTKAFQIEVRKCANRKKCGSVICGRRPNYLQCECASSTEMFFSHLFPAYQICN